MKDAWGHHFCGQRNIQKMDNSWVKTGLAERGDSGGGGAPTTKQPGTWAPSDGATNCFQSNTNSVIDHSATFCFGSDPMTD